MYIDIELKVDMCNYQFVIVKLDYRTYFIKMSYVIIVVHILLVFWGHVPIINQSLHGLYLKHNIMLLFMMGCECDNFIQLLNDFLVLMIYTETRTHSNLVHS